jgi:hypothetical protein
MKDRIGRGAALLLGIAYGAGMMYLLDPEIGPHRRALVREDLVRLRNRARRWALRQLRCAAGELHGSFLAMLTKMREGPLPDKTLERRIRAQLGHGAVAREMS